MVDFNKYKKERIEKRKEKHEKILEDIKKYDLHELLFDYEQNDEMKNIDYTLMKDMQDKNLVFYMKAEEILAIETETILDKWKKEGFNPFL